MTVLHLKYKADSDGKLRLGVMDVGVPGAEVDIVVSVKNDRTQEEWRQEMERALADMADVHVEAYPRRPYKDPWGEE